MEVKLFTQINRFNFLLICGVFFASCKSAPNDVLISSSPGKIATVNTLGQVYYVNNAQELSLLTLLPGDKVVMRSGNWNNQEIVFEGVGTEANPITLVADTAGQVIIKGRSNLVIDGEWLIVKDLSFKQGYSPDHVDAIKFTTSSSHCRLTNTNIEDYSHPTDSTKWVSISGHDNRVDYCSFTGKTSIGATLAVWLDGVADNHSIDHNYFGPRPVLGRNGGETIRLGGGTLSRTDSYTKIAYNVFDKCDGEGEIVSIKSNHNTISNNLFYESAGAVTIRQGTDNTVSYNYFIGNNKLNTGGVRITGENQTVYRNFFKYIRGLNLTATISIMDGTGASTITYADYFPVKKATVKYNIMVNSREAFNIGVGKSVPKNLIVAPDSLDISRNYVRNPTTLLTLTDTPTNMTLAYNQLYGATLIPGFIAWGDDLEEVNGIWKFKTDSTTPFWLTTTVGPSWKSNNNSFPIN